jgi:hypothetical protein
LDFRPEAGKSKAHPCFNRCGCNPPQADLKTTNKGKKAFWSAMSLEAISKKSFGPNSLLGAWLKSSKYFSIPPV